MKLVKTCNLENGWICCRYMYYKYGVLVIDLELGMFLEYSCIERFHHLSYWAWLLPFLLLW